MRASDDLQHTKGISDIRDIFSEQPISEDILQSLQPLTQEAIDKAIETLREAKERDKQPSTPTPTPVTTTADNTKTDKKSTATKNGNTNTTTEIGNKRPLPNSTVRKISSSSSTSSSSSSSSTTADKRVKQIAEQQKREALAKKKVEEQAAAAAAAAAAEATQSRTTEKGNSKTGGNKRKKGPEDQNSDNAQKKAKAVTTTSSRGSKKAKKAPVLPSTINGRKIQALVAKFEAGRKQHEVLPISRLKLESVSERQGCSYIDYTQTVSTMCNQRCSKICVGCSDISHGDFHMLCPMHENTHGYEVCTDLVFRQYCEFAEPEESGSDEENNEEQDNNESCDEEEGDDDEEDDSEDEDKK
jgi:hypothetical protein